MTAKNLTNKRMTLTIKRIHLKKKLILTMMTTIFNLTLRALAKSTQGTKNANFDPA
jgi:hypothetical protein